MGHRGKGDRRAKGVRRAGDVVAPRSTAQQTLREGGLVAAGRGGGRRPAVGVRRRKAVKAMWMDVWMDVCLSPACCLALVGALVVGCVVGWVVAAAPIEAGEVSLESTLCEKVPGR